MKSREFYRHKSEKLLIAISAITSIAIYVLLSYFGYEATLGNEHNNMILQILQIDTAYAGMIAKIGGYISITILLLIIIGIFFAYDYFSTKAKAFDVFVTEKQFPELIVAEEEYAKKLGITKLPRLFIANGNEKVDLFGIRFDNPNTIRINCEEIIASANKNYNGAKFSIAKHLASIYMGYYSPMLFMFTVFTSFIPILRQAGNRVISYTTDKIAAELVGKENAIDAIVDTSINIYFLPYLNTKEYIEYTKTVVKHKDLIWANMYSDIPVPAYRIEALRNDTDGKLF